MTEVVDRLVVTVDGDISGAERALKAVRPLLDGLNSEASQAVGGLVAGLSDQNAELRELGALAENVTDQLGAGFIDALSDGKIAFGEFRDIALSALSSIIDGLGQFVGISSGGGLLGTFTSLLSGAFGGTRADGGSVSPSRSYLVGEQGPEFFVPNVAGSILPNGVTPQTAMAPSVTININGVQDAEGVKRSSHQLVTALGRAMANSR